MNSFVMQKDELSVLFSLVENINIPSSILNTTPLNESNREKIIKRFKDEKIIQINEEGFVPDKGLELYLLPIVKCKRIFIFNYGYLENKHTNIFNISIYISANGIVALLDIEYNNVKICRFNNVNEISIFLPCFTKEKKSQYISYYIFEEKTVIANCSKLDGLVNIIESKSAGNDDLYHNKYSMSREDYLISFDKMLKEVCNVFSC